MCLCSSIETSAWITWGALYRAQGWSPGEEEEEEGGAAGPPRSAGPRPARPSARARSPPGTGALPAAARALPGSRGAARPPGRCGRSRGRAAALGGCELFPAENERSEVPGRCCLIRLVLLLHVCVCEGAEGRGGFVAIAGVWSVMRTRLSCAAFQRLSALLGGIYK